MRLRRAPQVLGAFLAVAWFLASYLDGGLGLTDTAQAPHPATDAGTVERVVDGDTLRLTDGRSIRLIGVDAPESVHPSEPVECYGPEASAFLSELLPVGADVTLELGAEPTDRYGRTLADVFADAEHVNLAIVATGHGTPLHIAPNTRYRGALDEAATSAQAQSLGLWGACS